MCHQRLLLNNINFFITYMWKMVKSIYQKPYLLHNKRGLECKHMFIKVSGFPPYRFLPIFKTFSWMLLILMHSAIVDFNMSKKGEEVTAIKWSPERQLMFWTQLHQLRGIPPGNLVSNQPQHTYAHHPHQSQPLCDIIYPKNIIKSASLPRRMISS